MGRGKGGQWSAALTLTLTLALALAMTLALALTLALTSQMLHRVSFQSALPSLLMPLPGLPSGPALRAACHSPVCARVRVLCGAGGAVRGRGRAGWGQNEGLPVGELGPNGGLIP